MFDMLDISGRQNIKTQMWTVSLLEQSHFLPKIKGNTDVVVRLRDIRISCMFLSKPSSVSLV